LKAWAAQLGNQKAHSLLGESLEEEEDMDEALTELAEDKSNKEAGSDGVEGRKARLRSRAPS
jgi:ferritin-like metal-binding protein YciE